MANIIEITDLNSPLLTPYTSLTGAQLINRRNPEQGLLIAESKKVIQCALDRGCRPASFLMERRQIAGCQELLSRWEDVPVYTGDRQLLSGLTGYALTRGVLCALYRPEKATAESVCANATRIALLENITDPTNLGSIFRSAAALGMDGVLISPSCCDPFHRRACRVSMGTVFQVPWARIGDTPADWPQKGLKQLKEWGFFTVAMALKRDSLSIRDPKLMQARKLALLLGTEGDGLMEDTIKGCDGTVYIPMSHGVDSLNVSAAATVAFWQLGNHNVTV